MSGTRRVVVTGFGAVSRLEADGEDAGLGVYASAVQPGQPGPGERPGHWTVTDFQPQRLIPETVLRRMDRFTQMAMVATHRALERAGLEITAERAERTGLVFNTCFGPFDSTRRYILKVIKDGAKKAPAAVFPNTVHNAFTGLITMHLKALGSNSTVSGYNPVCYGLDLIRNGCDDAMIVGGCDELIEPVISAFEAEGDTDPGSPRIRLGEGAAVLVLESAETAEARGATALAEVLDYGMSNCPSAKVRAFSCDGDSLAHAMRQALQRSGLLPGDIGAVSSCANGGERLGRAEEDALQAVFGEVRSPRRANLKPVLGETMGAGAPFGSLLGVALLQETGGPRHVMVNNVELGGTITSMVLGVAEGRHDAHAS